MLEGTIESLKSHGFPIEDTILALKPDVKILDANYKLNYLKENISANHTAYLFENEPVIIHKIEENLPNNFY